MKMSKIRRVRSSRRQGISFSMLRVCEGVSSSSKITTSISSSLAIRYDLLQFAGTDVDARRRLRQPLGETFSPNRCRPSRPETPVRRGTPRPVAPPDCPERRRPTRPLAANPPEKTPPGYSIVSFLPKNPFILCRPMSGTGFPIPADGSSFITATVSSTKQDTLYKRSEDPHQFCTRKSTGNVYLTRTTWLRCLPGDHFGDLLSTRIASSESERSGVCSTWMFVRRPSFSITNDRTTRPWIPFSRAICGIFHILLNPRTERIEVATLNEGIVSAIRERLVILDNLLLHSHLLHDLHIVVELRKSPPPW